MNFIRRQRMANRDANLLANPDFIAPVSDSVLLNLSNVSDESGTKSRRTLFGPLLEQPKGSVASLNKKPLPVEKKVIPADIVQAWVDRSKDVSRASLVVVQRIPYAPKSFQLTNLPHYMLILFSFSLANVLWVMPLLVSSS
jgi:hypothetical protein